MKMYTFTCMDNCLGFCCEDPIIYRNIWKIFFNDLKLIPDFCKDSSDSSYDEATFDVVEYEVETSSDSEGQFDLSSSGTDVS